MKIVISSGHGKYIRGASDIIDEVDEARNVVDAVARNLEAAGVQVVEFHDDVSTTQSENLDRIVDFHNAQGPHDLDISVHFNAYEHTAEPMGTEVLYVTQEDLAREVSAAIAQAGELINRGPKYRGDLAFLNGTNAPAILIETCFVDSEVDTELYEQNFNAICSAIASAVSGEAAVKPPPERPPVQPPERPDLPGPGAEQPVLDEGATGPAVASVQQTLGLPADGQFGPVTTSGVKSFQGATGLAKDGIVGPVTWEALAELNKRLLAGNSGLDAALEAAIERTVLEASPLWDISWPDRGSPPPGYYSGLAKCFALAIRRYRVKDAAAIIMARAAGDPDDDALAYYAEEFSDLGMTVSTTGITTLRHLFVLMYGLGMRESSGVYCEGRDMSADNVASDTCEAGLFQTSWNISSCSSTIDDLLEEYWEDPEGFHSTFAREIYPTASQLDSYGSGDGARYQWLSRRSPAFHTFVTAVGLRLRKDHWGPIIRYEVDLMPEVNDMLMDVQRLVTKGV